MNAIQRRRASRRERFGEIRNGWGQLYNPYNTHYPPAYGYASFRARGCIRCKQIVNWGRTTASCYTHWLNRGQRFECPKCKMWQNIPLLPTIKVNRTKRNDERMRHQTKPR